MARDDDPWKRFREREQEDKSLNKKPSARNTGPIQKGEPAPSPKDPLSDSIHRAETMIDQINHLYQMYLAGVERTAPLERRKQLNELIAQMQNIPKPTPAASFRYTMIKSKYSSHCERWDRIMKEIESGKIKRATGPKR